MPKKRFARLVLLFMKVHQQIRFFLSLSHLRINFQIRSKTVLRRAVITIVGMQFKSKPSVLALRVVW